jgi:hypothetical protein
MNIVPTIDRVVCLNNLEGIHHHVRVSYLISGILLMIFNYS